MEKDLDERVERRLIRCLTRACDESKASIAGFLWLTHHSVNGQVDGLRVIWVFDTESNLVQAMRDGSERYIQAQTESALKEAGLSLPEPTLQVQLDSEERCRQEHGGDWERRLSEPRVSH